MILSSVVTIGRPVFVYPHIMGQKTMFVLPELTWLGEAALQGAGAATASTFPWSPGKSARLGTASSICFLKRWGWAYNIPIWNKFSKEASNSVCSCKILHSAWQKHGESLSQNCLDKESDSCDLSHTFLLLQLRGIGAEIKEYSRSLVGGGEFAVLPYTASGLCQTLLPQHMDLLFWLCIQIPLCYMGVFLVKMPLFS